MSTKIFQKIPVTIGTSEFRADLKNNFAKAKKEPVIISEKRGGDSFVLLSQIMYNKLVEAYEDELDSRKLMRLVEANKGKRLIPWNKVKEM
jgi:hypothetical protein